MATSPSVLRDAARSLAEARKQITRIGAPIGRARAAERLIRLCQTEVEATAEIRRAAVRQMYEDGWTLTDISSEFKVSRARAHQIINA